MEISLDYYRILGVPVQADLDLIEQAYHDRIIQLPHKGYTEYAINSRKNLIQQAYDVLTQEESRLQYESSFLSSDLDTEISESEDFSYQVADVHIDIEPSLFVGALIILLDLGEYELIINLIQPYLLDRTQLNIFSEKEEEISLISQDLVLTIVLGYLELATEQWQEKQYESASNSLKQAHDLLLRENLFKDLRQEIKEDLGKLLPYEILELLTKEDSHNSDREKAINFLKSMLKTRGGIESKKIDDSGLDIDGFLKFIQQIRVYLTPEEQQNIFEEEAKRPSPAAGYLAAYAGIARGFSERKPEFIIRAKNSLISLTIHQDVYLEQSICALLLGQTAEAEFSLSQSREKQVINYIQEMSQNSPDLLPGLCIYTEKWLQTEVFPQFKNLSNTNPSLQDYFGDDRVQTYLEKINLPLTPELKENESLPELELAPNAPPDSSYSFSQFNALKEQTDYEEQIINQTYLENHSSNLEMNTGDNTLETKNIALLIEDDKTENNEDLVGFDDFLTSEVVQEKAPSHHTAVMEKEIPSPQESSSVQRDLKKEKNNQFLILASVMLLLLFASIGIFASRMLLKNKTIPLEISLSESLIELPSLNPPPVEIGKLNKDTALEIINQWLKAKINATGPEYNSSELNKILTEPLLSKWVGNSRDLRRQNAYRRYEHQVSIESAQINPQDATQGVITAKVEEKSQYYRNGALVPTSSYQDNLSLTYYVVKEGNQWFIKDVKIRN